MSRVEPRTKLDLERIIFIGDLDDNGYSVEEVQGSYEFQLNANSMLTIKKKSVQVWM